MRTRAALGVALALSGCGQAAITSRPALPTTAPSASPATPTPRTTPTAPGSPTTQPTPTATATPSGWRQGPDLPVPRAEFGAGVMHEQLYAVGGFDALHRGEWLTEVDVYTASYDSWDIGIALPIGRDHPMVAVLDDRLYVFGGFGDGGLRGDTVVYDLDFDAWRTVADMPARRAQGAAVTIGERIYIFGGITPAGPGGAALETWAYDPTTDSWTAGLAPIPTKRNHLMAVELDGRAWVMGGRWDVNETAVESYDPATDTWQTEAPLAVATGGASAAVLDGLIHVTGGEDLANFSTIGAHQLYDPTAASWFLGPELPVARHGLASGVIGDQWIVVGGGAAADYAATDRVDIYAP